MFNPNPFNFIDPMLTKFPATKLFQPIGNNWEENPRKSKISYFQPTTIVSERQIRWAYDNYFIQNLQFDQRQRRSDRANIKMYFENIHAEEMERLIPAATQTLYGHQALRCKYNPRPEPQFNRRSDMCDFYRSNGIPWPKYESKIAGNKNLLDILKPEKL